MFKSTYDFALNECHIHRSGEVCGDLVELGISPEHKIIDFGCGTGELVYEFQRHGYQNVYGIGTNWFSLNFGAKRFHLCDDSLQYFSYESLKQPCDWMLALDILQKIEVTDLEEIVKSLAAKRLVVRIPVSPLEGYDYFEKADRENRDNIICHIREWWIELLSVKYEFACKIFGKKLVDTEGAFVGMFYKKEER